MADNVVADEGTGGATFATDDIGGVHYPITKLTFGALDSQTIASSNSGASDAGTLRVTLATDDTVTVDNGGTFAVQAAQSGTWTVDLGATDNAVLDSIAAGFAVEGAALGSGVLLQGDDGTDRTNVLVDTDGHLQVDVLSGGGGGTEYDEDAATPGTITGTATVMERDDALITLTPAAGDWAAMRCSAEGALWVQDFNSDAILADTASMDTNLGTIAGAVSGTEMQVDVVAALPAGTNNIGDVDIASLPNEGQQTMANSISVAIASNQGALDVSGATVTVDLGSNNDVQGDVAHDAVDSGNPIKIGARARTSDVTSVANNDRVDLIADKAGKVVVMPYALPENMIDDQSTNTGTGDTALFAAPGAGLRNYVTTIIVSNNNASSDTELIVKDGTTEIMRIPSPAGGGATINLAVPLRQPTSNTAINTALTGSVSTVTVSAVGYTGA